MLETLGKYLLVCRTLIPKISAHKNVWLFHIRSHNETADSFSVRRNYRRNAHKSNFGLSRPIAEMHWKRWWTHWNRPDMKTESNFAMWFGIAVLARTVYLSVIVKYGKNGPFRCVTWYETTTHSYGLIFWGLMSYILVNISPKFRAIWLRIKKMAAFLQPTHLKITPCTGWRKKRHPFSVGYNFA